MKKILFISATARVDRPYLDPSVRYRCYNPAMLLNSYDFIVDVISFKKFTLEIIPRYDIFVFHRPSYEKKLLDAVGEINDLGLSLFADYDDLIFSQKYALESSLYKNKRATKEECLNIFKNNEKALFLFKNFIVSTRPLREKILELDSSLSVSVVSNAISEDVINRLEIQKEFYAPLKTDKIIISYLSGTASHDKDFEIVEDVLSNLLLKYKNKIELQIVGPLSYNRKKLQDALHIPYVDYECLGKLIAKTDINIAPLEINNFTNCKSGLKFFESGLLGVPSVVTPIDDMKRFEDSNGITYASSKEEWHEELEKLILDEVHYMKKSKNTYSYMLKHCTMNNVYEDYLKIFERDK